MKFIKSSSFKTKWELIFDKKFEFKIESTWDEICDIAQSLMITHNFSYVWIKLPEIDKVIYTIIKTED